MHAAYFAFLTAIIAFTVFGDAGLLKLYTERGLKSNLEKNITRIQKRISILEHEKRRLANPAYLESVVRKELGYIKKGEVVYQIIK